MSLGKIKAQTDHLEQLKQIREKMTNPLSQKYLDKAIEHNQPQVDHNPKESQISDPHTYQNYDRIFTDVKKLAEIGNHSNELIKKIYDKQVKLKGAFERLSIANQYLLPYLRPDTKQIVLNEDSQKLLGKIQENYEEIKTLIEDIKKFTEESFDKIHGVML